MTRVSKEKLKKLGEKLERIAKEWNFTQKSEYRLIREDFGGGKGADIDFVWLMKTSGVDDPIPIVGFEIETGKRASKHLKGDVYNLLCLRPALGIVLFIKEGFASKKLQRKLERHKEAINRYSELLFKDARILAWTDEDIEKLRKPSINKRNKKERI